MILNEAEKRKMVVSEAAEVFEISERQGHHGSAFFSLPIGVWAFGQIVVFFAISVENLPPQKAAKYQPFAVARSKLLSARGWIHISDCALVF